MVFLRPGLVYSPPRVRVWQKLQGMLSQEIFYYEFVINNLKWVRELYTDCDMGFNNSDGNILNSQ